MSLYVFYPEHVTMTRVLLRRSRNYLHDERPHNANYKTTEVVVSNLVWRPKQQKKQEAFRKRPTSSKPNRLDMSKEKYINTKVANIHREEMSIH